MGNSLPKAILLDLDDTILASSETAGRLWQDVCERFVPQIEGLAPAELFKAIQECRVWFWGDSERANWGHLDPAQARRELVAEAFSRLNVDSPELANEIADAVSLGRVSVLRLLPGATETLLYLRDEGVRLALVTGGNADLQRRKIDRFKLAPFFDCILIEGEFGVSKSDERIYKHALDQLGVEPKDAWSVGDGLEWDVQVPQRLGVWGIWLCVASDGIGKKPPMS